MDIWIGERQPGQEETDRRDTALLRSRIHMHIYIHTHTYIQQQVLHTHTHTHTRSIKDSHIKNPTMQRDEEDENKEEEAENCKHYARRGLLVYREPFVSICKKNKYKKTDTAQINKRTPNKAKKTKKNKTLHAWQARNTHYASLDDRIYKSSAAWKRRLLLFEEGEEGEEEGQRSWYIQRACVCVCAPVPKVQVEREKKTNCSKQFGSSKPFTSVYIPTIQKPDEEI